MFHALALPCLTAVAYKSTHAQPAKRALLHGNKPWIRLPACPGCCSVWKTEGPVHGDSMPLSNATTLLPEAAQLQFLTRMELEIDAAVVGLPPEWGQPGAFPSLQ